MNILFFLNLFYNQCFLIFAEHVQNKKKVLCRIFLIALVEKSAKKKLFIPLKNADIRPCPCIDHYIVIPFETIMQFQSSRQNIADSRQQTTDSWQYTADSRQNIISTLARFTLAWF